MSQLSTYSFLDFMAGISGPGGSINLGQGAGVGEEGCTIEMAEDKGTLTIGADGTPMHSLHGGRAGMLTLRLLKTSPTNALLYAMYELQALSSANWGQNTIVISDSVRGDVITCTAVAFKKVPNLTYAKVGGMNEWTFNAGRINGLLGAAAAFG